MFFRNNNFRKNILPVLLVMVLFLVLISASTALAVEPVTGTAASGGGGGGSGWWFGFETFTNMLNAGIAIIFSLFVAAAGLILNMAASILNVSIIMTLNIKELVSNTPAIYTVWATIRDITGLFFIFYLLHAAFQMILGIGSNYGTIIKNIVIAAILVNFSFFLTSVLIDASNIVSQALYNSMTPSYAKVTLDGTTTIKSLTANLSGESINGQRTTPGIADIFMNSLKIQSLYDTKAMNSKATTGDPFKIILINIIAIMMMLTTAASFILAAAAFIARLVILLFLLAFSPIWFLGSVIKEIDKYTGQFRTALFSQLIFMPVYLLLMYVALTLINSSNMLGMANVSVSGMPNMTNWAFGYTVLAVNFALVIIILNLPLLVGLSMGGRATSWMSGAMKMFDAKNIWSRLGGGTIGRTAYALNQSSTVRSIAASSPLIGGLVSKGLTKASKTGFGVKGSSYEDRLKVKKKSQEELYKTIGNVERGNYKDQTAFDKARDQAKEFQKTYISKLPWNGVVGSVIGTVISRRAGRETAFKLDKKARDEEKKKEKKVNQKKLSEINDKLKGLTEEEKELSKESTSQGLRADLARLAQIKTERADLEGKKEKVEKDIDDATEAEEKEKNKEILDAIKEEKKEEKKKE